MKQVIVLRRDLKMSAGKAASQAAHAAMLFILKRLRHYYSSENFKEYFAHFSPEQDEWMFEQIDTIPGWEYGGIKKIVLGCKDYFELQTLAEVAKLQGLECHFVIDETLQATTALAIGPDVDEKFIGVTDHLRLYPEEESLLREAVKDFFHNWNGIVITEADRELLRKIRDLT
jgi:peptidyl-tRNA hydrolase